jgi:hypothetical protein
VSLIEKKIKKFKNLKLKKNKFKSNLKEEGRS